MDNTSDRTIVSAGAVGFVTGMIAVICLLIGLGATPKHQLQKDRQEAISHGVAQWVVNLTNGEVNFVWNTATNR